MLLPDLKVPKYTVKTFFCPENKAPWRNFGLKQIQCCCAEVYSNVTEAWEEKKQQLWIPLLFLPELYHILADENISTRLFDFFFLSPSFSSFQIQGRSAHLKAPIYSSAQVERRPPPHPSPPTTLSSREWVFWGGAPSWKEDKSRLVSLIVATPARGSRAGISPRAAWRSPTRAAAPWLRGFKKKKMMMMRRGERERERERSLAEGWEGESGSVRDVGRRRYAALVK